MIYFSIGFLVLLFAGLVACRNRAAEFLSEIDKKEHKLYMLYPLAWWILQITGYDKKLSRKAGVSNSIKALYNTNKPEQQVKLYWCKQGATVLFILALFNLLSIMSLLATPNSAIIRERFLKRPPVGSGNKQLELKVTLEDTQKTGAIKEEELTREIVLDIPARRYREEEVTRLFEEATKYLETAILGNNQSKDQIYEKINLCANIPGTSIAVDWDIEDHELIQMDGTIRNDSLDKKGKDTKVTAILSYLNYRSEYTINLHIMPKQYTESEIIKQKLDAAINTASEQSAYEDLMELPEAVEGYRLHWSEKEGNTGEILLFLGLFATVLVWFYGGKELNKQMKLRNNQLMLDYPEVVNKFTLLVNAGMTARQAFYKITEDYEIKQQAEKLPKRYAYEEMRNTVREMKLGLPEVEAYEQFGKRIGLVPYIKFGALISQNLKKGNKSFTELLIQEGTEAFEERKEVAKRLGEEAGAKLLIPMFIMLIIVFLIILIPAFMSFGI